MSTNTSIHRQNVKWSAGCWLQLNCQRPAPVFVFGVYDGFQFSDPQRFICHEEHFSSWRSCKNLGVLLTKFSLTLLEMGSHRAWILNMFSESALQMTASLTDIARIAAWTLKFVHNAASEHLLQWWFCWGQDCLQFPQCHDYHAGGVASV